ncbi:MAG: hypothetical protein ACFFBD_20315, partial [Candidatus Hodarchaeota archaeon]
SITGNIYEVIVGESCIYEGVVGEINDEALHNQLEYAFGLFVYYQNHSFGCNYQVINYWVREAIPYEPTSSTSSSIPTTTTSATTLGILVAIVLLVSIRVIKIRFTIKENRLN